MDEKSWDRSRKSRTLSGWRVYPTGRSSAPSREHAWKTRGGNPLQWQAEGIITTAGMVNADETGRSRPIGAACRPARKTTWLIALQVYSTAQNHATSVSHAYWPLWYPLDVKRRARSRSQGKTPGSS
jgi:hypothetical protein